MNDELPGRLRVTAEEYQPNTERMWARVADGMRGTGPVRAEPVRSRWRVPHLAIATGAALTLVGGIIVFGPALGPDVTEPAGPADEVTTTGSGAPPTDYTSPAEDDTADAPDQTKPEPVDDVDWLQADGAINAGSNPYWSQSDVMIANDERLTELTIVLHVAGASFVESTDSWTTSGPAFTEAEVSEEDGYLMYRWTLKDGAVLEPGEYTLAGQYNHSSGARTAVNDYFVFTAVAENGDEGELIGTFE